jgi:hypothetical protein
MSLTKLFLGGNNFISFSLFPPWESLSSLPEEGVVLKTNPVDLATL